MATSSGWAALGNTIAGGNKLNSALAYDQGEALGARTQDALAQARQRIDKNNALEHIDEGLAGIPGFEDPKTRAGVAKAIQAGVPLEQLSGFANQQFQLGQRRTAADPTASDDAAARALFSIGSNDQVLRTAGANGEYTNVLHPSQGVQMTDLGRQIAQSKQAETQASTAEKQSTAAKNADQIAHPEKYRLVPPAPGSQGGATDGSQPIKDETTAQLVAQGLMPAPAPGTRGYLMLGGDDFVKRVNFLAGQGKGGTTPVPAAGGTPAPVAPAGAAPKGDGIKLPAETAPPFQASFDANAYGQRRTALNDLSRKSGTGGNNDALNRTAGHLDVYEQLLQNSGNTNFVAGNQLKNWFQQQTGKPYPGNASLAAHILGTEIVKSMTSVGAGTGEERTGLAGTFSNANSLGEASGAIDTAQRLLREQAVATNQRVSASGVKDYYSKYLTPTTRRRLALGEFETPAPGAAAAVPAGAAAPAGVATIKSDAEFNALPSGAHFMGPDGKERVKP